MMSEGLTSSLHENADLGQIIRSLMVETQHIQDEDPSLRITEMDFLINDLKHLLLQERNTYSLARQSSARRRQLESLRNLIDSLDSHMQTMRRIMSCAHLCKSCLLYRILLRRSKDAIQSKLQSWLDEQCVRELSAIIGPDHVDEDAQTNALCSFETIVCKGYDASIQEAILLCGLVTKLASLLDANTVSWRVQKRAALAIKALLVFNKDIFVSLVLMANVVKKILALMDTESDENVLFLLSVLKSMLSVGHTIVVDEIYSHDGVPKIVNLLIDCKLEALQFAAFDCILELVYNGRIEVLSQVFQCNVVKNLVMLRSSYKETTRNSASCSSQDKDHGNHRDTYPFVNALSDFATQFAIGIGLREREKQASRQVFLRQIKEIIQDDVEVANISIKVLWGPR